MCNGVCGNGRGHCFSGDIRAAAAGAAARAGMAVGASVAIVFIEPSPYELITVAAAVIFVATGLRLRLVFVPPLLLLFLVNVGYSIGAIPFLDKPEVANWIATSWYMAVTVMFLAMVVSEDTGARLDMLRRGLIVGALIASTAAIAGYFNLVPGGHDLLTLYDRGRGTFKDPNVLGAFLILPSLFVLQSVVSARRQIVPQRDRVRRHGARDPAGFFPRRLGRADPDLGFHAGIDGVDQPVAPAALAYHRDRGRCRHRRGDAARGAAVVQLDQRNVQTARELRPKL